MKALNRKWDHRALVEHIFQQVPEDFVKRQAGKLYALITNAKAIQPLPTEPVQQLGFVS